MHYAADAKELRERGGRKVVFGTAACDTRGDAPKMCTVNPATVDCGRCRKTNAWRFDAMVTAL